MYAAVTKYAAVWATVCAIACNFVGCTQANGRYRTDDGLVVSGMTPAKMDGFITENRLTPWRKWSFYCGTGYPYIAPPDVIAKRYNSMEWTMFRIMERTVSGRRVFLLYDENTDVLVITLR